MKKCGGCGGNPESCKLDEIDKLKKIIRAFVGAETDAGFMERAMEHEGVKINWDELLDLIKEK